MTTIDENSRPENSRPLPLAPEAHGVPVTSTSVVPPEKVREENAFNTVINQLPPNTNTIL